ncbi:MAG: NADH-quinone oxidoreductase subunit NuoN [Rhodocyclaceae bacterium]|nr:NADH-quinone oxidoreductase subunit NuoN [Rhodocyclaceae bacterium]
MISPLPDLYPASAEIFIVIMACVVLLADLFFGKQNRWLSYCLTLATLAGAFVIQYAIQEPEPTRTFNGMFIADHLAVFLKMCVYVSVAMVILYSRQYLGDKGMDRSEFYLLTLFATLGMQVMIAANSFLTIYLGLELLSLSLYAMVAMDRDSVRATEAAMKYFVLGALASGLLLYGMSMIYGATGTLDIYGIAVALDGKVDQRLVLQFGLVFLVAGLAFKLGVVPFHMWIPDVYHGAPTAVTLLISSAPKLAAIAMVLRLLVNGLYETWHDWQQMLTVLAVLSIGLGNLVAIAQTNLKRMLAYSAISHMGFMLLGLISGRPDTGVALSAAGASDAMIAGAHDAVVNSYGAALFYSVTYVLMSLASFGVIVLMSRAGFEAENIDDMKGLNQRSPWFAAVMMMTMFSLAGVPFFVGFFAKFSVLSAVVSAQNYSLAIYAVLMSLVGAFYYLRVVKVIYFDQPVEQTPIRTAGDLRIMLTMNGVAIAVLGLLPQGLIHLCNEAIRQSFWH